MLLSLEFNKITSLVGFPDLKNLLELYLSHNLIKDIKEIV
jgi:Leucine-rich repeat (LRR) protein